jgi:hypothetical protein
VVVKTQLVRRYEDLPAGSHSLSFYGSPLEAARNMAGFLKGAQEFGQEALILTASESMHGLYRGEISKRTPDLVGSVRRISGLHIGMTTTGYRPVAEVMDFAASHPEGATLCGDTIPSILDRRSLPNILAYEDWFDSLRPFKHRGLCPYDLTSLPVDQAPEALGRLLKAHSHAVLSSDPNPGVRFLQLLVLPHVENPPEENLRWLAHAVDYGLLEQKQDGDPAGLTPRGRDFARALLRLPTYVRAARSLPGAH